MKDKSNVVYCVFFNEDFELIGYLITKSNEEKYNKFFGFKQVLGSFKRIKPLMRSAMKNNVDCRVYISTLKDENKKYQYADIMRYLKEEGNSSIFVCLEKDSLIEDSIKTYDVDNFFVTKGNDSLNLIFDTLLCLKSLR